MAYMRDQRNAAYGSDYPQRGYRLSNLSVVQPQVKQSSGSYNWGSTSGHTTSTSWQKSYAEDDYGNYGYGGSQLQRIYEQDEGAGFKKAMGVRGKEGIIVMLDNGMILKEVVMDEDYGSRWQGRDDSSGMKWRDSERGGGGKQWQGEERDNSSMQWQSQGGDDSDVQWQSQGRDGSGSQWQGQGRDDSGLLWQGQGREKSEALWQGQERDDSGLHWQGQGRDNSGIQWQGEGRDDSGIEWKGQGGDNSGIEWQDQTRHNSGKQWLGQKKEMWQDQEGDDNGLHWVRQKRDNSSTQWQGQGRDDNGDVHRQSQRRDNSGIHWQGQGRDSIGAEWQDQGRSKSGIRWPSQGNIGGLGRGKGLRNGVATGSTSSRGVRGEGMNVLDSDMARGESASFGARYVRGRGVGRQRSTFVSNEGIIRYFGGSSDRSEVNTGGEIRETSSGRGGRGGRGLGRGGHGLGRGGRGLGRGGRGRGGEGQGGRGLGRGGRGLGRGGLGRNGEGQGGRGLGRGEHGLGRGGEGQGGHGLSRGGCGLGRGGRGLGRGGRGLGRGGRGLGRGGGRGSSFSVAVGNTAGQATLHESAKRPPKGSLMAGLIEKWQAVTKGFADTGNAVSIVESSLEAAKLHVLKMNFDCQFFTKCGIYSTFTGVLLVNRLSNRNNIPVESVFLARSQALSKRSCKTKCYEEAYRILMNLSVEEIMARKDSSEKTLMQEIQANYRNNPKEFFILYREGVVSGLCSDAGQLSQGDKARPGQLSQGDKARPGQKRNFSGQPAGPDAKKSRLFDSLTEMLDNKRLSLAPTKATVVMSPTDPLIDKLEMLKKLQKEEGITRLHIVPKIDQLAHKAAIRVQNVYRLEVLPGMPVLPMFGLKPRTSVYCEIYFDDVYMTKGPADCNKQVATQKAYSNLAGQLCSKPLHVMASNPRIWNPYMALDLDVHHVVTKLHWKDNDSFLTSNLFNIKQMMRSAPDITIPIEQMVLTEQEADKNVENGFKSLELSATRNLMLLECEIMRNPDTTFSCTMSLQGKILATRIHQTKNIAKRQCSEVIMTNLKKTQDIIYVKKEMIGRTITKSEIHLSAAQKKAKGEPPAKIFWRKQAHRDDKREIRGPQDDRENLPENVQARPLFPWIAAAVYEILDEYYQKITLEDLNVDLEDMPRSQRDILFSCAAKMGLHMVTKAKYAYDGPILRRTVTAQDMSKILQLQGGESGRYKLVSCKNPLSEEKLEKFRKQYLEKYQKLVEARTNEIPDEQPEPLSEKGDRLGSSSSSGGKLPTGSRSQQAKHTPTRSAFRVSPRPQLSASKFKFSPRGRGFLGGRRGGGSLRSHMRSGFRSVMSSYLLGQNPYSTY